MGLLLLLACVVGISFYLFAASFVLLGSLAPHSGVTLFGPKRRCVCIHGGEKHICRKKRAIGRNMYKSRSGAVCSFAVSSMIYIYGAEGAKHGLNAFGKR